MLPLPRASMVTIPVMRDNLRIRMRSCPDGGASRDTYKRIGAASMLESELC
jgi:hypothetical protein